MPRKLEEPRTGEVSKTTEAWRKATMDHKYQEKYQIQTTTTTLMCILASFTIVGTLIYRNNHHDWENLHSTSYNCRNHPQNIQEIHASKNNFRASSRRHHNENTTHLHNGNKLSTHKREKLKNQNRPRNQKRN